MLVKQVLPQLWSALPALSALSGGRLFATISAGTEAERDIAKKIESSIKGATHIMVKDSSGGCGEFYNIEIVAPEFRGHSIVKQHQLVHGIIKAEMEKWHGLNLVTKAPPA